RPRRVRALHARAALSDPGHRPTPAPGLPHREAPWMRRGPAPEPGQERHGGVSRGPVEIVGIGIDLVDVERMRRSLAGRFTFVQRVFTPEEVAYCERQASPEESFAARWAAREACRKALGGIRHMR